jgi:hypothetical protein
VDGEHLGLGSERAQGGADRLRVGGVEIAADGPKPTRRTPRSVLSVAPA